MKSTQLEEKVILEKRLTIERSIPKPHLDHRTSKNKNHKIIEFLMNFYDRNQLIPFKDVSFAISEVRGDDPRTQNKALEQLVKYGFLKPASKQKLRKEKVVRCRSRRGSSTIVYESEKGYAYYRFGPRAPMSFQSVLNPPIPPTNKSEGLELRKNVCVGLSEGSKLRGTCSHIELINKNNNKRHPHTHIFPALEAKTTEPTSKILHKQLNPLEQAILRIDSGCTSHGGVHSKKAGDDHG